MTHILTRTLLALALSVAVAGSGLNGAHAESDRSAGNVGIEIKIAENAGVYTVYMRPNATPNSPYATTSAQVTIKVPHGFVMSDLTSGIAGTAWSLGSRTDAPPEAPNSDYLSFDLDFPTGNYQAIQWAANTEQAMFSFKGDRSGAHVMDDCDAFAPPNSQEAYVGNELRVINLVEGNAYIGNYDQVADCPTAQQAMSAVNITMRSSVADGAKIAAGDLVTYTYTISNTGLRMAQGLHLKVDLQGLANSAHTENSFGMANPILQSNSSATWQLSELDPGEAGQVVLVLASPTSNDVLTTTAQVSATNDADTSDNFAMQTVQVVATAPPLPAQLVYLPLLQR